MIKAQNENMSRFLRVLQKLTSSIVVVAIAFFISGNLSPAYAARCATMYSANFVPGGDKVDGGSFESGVSSISFTLGFASGSLVGKELKLYKYNQIWGIGNDTLLDTKTVGANNQVTFNITNSAALNGEGDVSLTLDGPEGKCELADYKLTETFNCKISFAQNGVNNPGCYDSLSGDITVNVTDLARGVETNFSGDGFAYAHGPMYQYTRFTAQNGTFSFQVKPESNYPVKIVFKERSAFEDSAFWTSANEACSANVPSVQAIKCTDESVNAPATNVDIPPFTLCGQISNLALRRVCDDCQTNKQGVWTAIGCIKTDPVSIAQQFITLGLGIAGGVSLISTLVGGFMLTTSQGDPTKANEAKEIITSAIIGLLFVIFSVAILQFIGVSVLRIPGFGTQ